MSDWLNFQVFVRIVNALEKPPALFVLGQMQEKFHDARAVAIQVFFQIQDGAIPPVPDIFVVEQFLREFLARGEIPDGRARSSTSS